MSCAPLLCRVASFASHAKTESQCARAKSRASTVIQSGAARRCVHEARPPAGLFVSQCGVAPLCVAPFPPRLPGLPVPRAARAARMRKSQPLPSIGIFGTNAVKVPILIALCISNQNACHHAVQGNPSPLRARALGARVCAGTHSKPASRALHRMTERALSVAVKGSLCSRPSAGAPLTESAAGQHDQQTSR